MLSVARHQKITKWHHLFGPGGIQLFTGTRIKRVTLPWVMLGDSWFMNEWNEGVVLNWSRHLIPWKAFPRLRLRLRWASCELYVERVWWRVHPPSLRKQNRLQAMIIGARVTLPYKFQMNCINVWLWNILLWNPIYMDEYRVNLKILGYNMNIIYIRGMVVWCTFYWEDRSGLEP